MKAKVVLACLLAVGLASPALADYYIVQNSKYPQMLRRKVEAIRKEQDRVARR